MFKGLMAGVSGIRGIVGEGMTPEVALLWSGGFATWVKGGKVVVGRDPRPSGEMLNMAVLAGLTAAGCDVDDVGITPTPTAALAVERRGAAGGIIITASHNPQEWNALKFVGREGRMISEADFDQLQQIVSEGPLRAVAWDQLGRVNRWDGAEVMYISAVAGLRILQLDRIKGKQFRVAIDCVNGAGSRIYPRLLQALGCEVIAVNCTPTGIFPRGPEPAPEHITELCRIVVAERCAAGFAVDPDGDRLAAVDESGVPLGEELTLAMAMKPVLEVTPGPVVVNSLTSQVIDNLAEKFGTVCHRTRVGEANVAIGMKELGAVIGGEGNGGLIYPELHYVRDAGVGMALILNDLSRSRRSLSELRGELPSYYMVKRTYPLGERSADEMVAAVERHYQHDQISRIDGLRIISDDGWVQVRGSNTEPILRVYAESSDSAHAAAMVDEMIKYLDEIVSIK